MFIIILALGLWLLVYGISALSARIKLVPMSKAITGTVIGLHETRAKRNRTAYFPVIEYYDPETNCLESFEHEAASGRSTYNIGDNLELIYYNSGDKKMVLINTWSGIWLAPIAFIIGGIIIFAFGVLMKLMP